MWNIAFVWATRQLTFIMHSPYDVIKVPKWFEYIQLFRTSPTYNGVAVWNRPFSYFVKSETWKMQTFITVVRYSLSGTWADVKTDMQLRNALLLRGVERMTDCCLQDVKSVRWLTRLISSYKRGSKTDIITVMYQNVGVFGLRTEGIVYNPSIPQESSVYTYIS